MNRTSFLRWAAALSATLALLGLEWLGAQRSGSQALWADAIHVGLDALAILVAGLVLVRPGQGTVRGVLVIQAGLLVLLGGLSGLRVLGILPAHQHFTDPDLALRVALVGLAANVGAAWMLRGDHGLRGALMHAVADAAGSLLAVAGLALAKATGDASWDGLAAVAICATMWLLAALLVAGLLQRDAPALGHEHERPAAGSAALAAFLIACTLLVAATATQATPTPVWRFLHPSEEIAHGELTGVGPWDPAMQAPAGSLSARIRLELEGTPNLLAEPPSFDIRLVHDGQVLSHATWDPGQGPLTLATSRWSPVPVEVRGGAERVAASLPELPARELVLVVEPRVTSLAPAVDSGWQISWRTAVETVEPFEVRPTAPVGCPPPKLWLAGLC